MKVMLWIVGFLFVVGMAIQTVSAEQTVKTIEVPLGYEAVVIENTISYFNLSVNYPDGISKILSMELLVKGDFLANTINVGGFLYEGQGDIIYCTPDMWTIYRDADNYEMSFDCSDLIQQSDWKGGNLTFGFLSTQVAGNLKTRVKITYENKPKVSVIVHGTEYVAGNTGKIFIQLLDESAQPVSGSECYASIYYPNDEVYKYQQLMSYLDEGLYDYDFEIPYTKGVYPVAVVCTVKGVTYDASNLAWDNFETGTISGGDGWDTNWALSSCLINEDQAHSGTYSLHCRDDRDPSRRIDSNLTYVRLDYDFWYRATGFGNGEYVYVEMQDASGVEHQLQVISNANADGAWKHVTGSLSLEADIFDFDGQIRFELDTSGNVDNNDHYYIDDLNITLGSAIAINDTEYQIVRGSGEAHVSSDEEYYVEMDYGTLTNETFDGYMYMYYNVISAVAENKTEREVSLHVWNAFPCEHIENIYIKNKTTDVWDEISFHTFLRTKDNDRCGIHYDQDFAVGEIYELKIKASNFWRTEMLSKYNADIMNQKVIRDGCNYYQSQEGLPAYSVPLSSDPTETDLFYLNCLYYFNTFHHYNETMMTQFVLYPPTEINMTFDEMEQMEGIYNNLKEESEILSKTMQGIINVWNQGNDYSLTILDGVSNETYLKTFAGVSGNYMNYLSLQNVDNVVWNFENRSLTEFNFTVPINTTSIAVAVWNYTGTIYSGILDQISASVWGYTTRILTAFGFDIVDEDAISTTVWNETNRSLTEFDFATSVNTTSISNAVWDSSNRTLTDFGFSIGVNTTEISDAVWNENNTKYTHGVVLN